MARAIQLRRGNAAENDNFTGLVAEVTVDTTNKTLRVHDGETLGGIALARQNQLCMNTVDYSAGIDITNAMLPFTAPADGVIIGSFFVNESYAYCSVDGTAVMWGGGEKYNECPFTLPISKGSTFTTSGMLWTAGNPRPTRFYPFKPVA